MTVEQLIKYSETNKVHLNRGYLYHCVKYSKQDKHLMTGTHIHHIIPKCLGGKDDKENLIKISIEHHKALHRNIIQSYRPKKKSNTITKAQYKKLLYAMCLMNNIKLPKWLNYKHNK